jgi:hypothetical protein
LEKITASRAGSEEFPNHESLSTVTGEQIHSKSFEYCRPVGKSTQKILSAAAQGSSSVSTALFGYV